MVELAADRRIVSGADPGKIGRMTDPGGPGSRRRASCSGHPGRALVHRTHPGDGTTRGVTAAGGGVIGRSADVAASAARSPTGAGLYSWRQERRARTQPPSLAAGRPRRGRLSLVTGCGLLPAARPAPTRVPRIGFLSVGAMRAEYAVGTFGPQEDAFSRGLAELGYVEGRNIVVEWRWGVVGDERLPSIADELVRLPVDVLVTGASAATEVAKRTTTSVPIVMAHPGDPVAGGGSWSAWRGRAGTSPASAAPPRSSPASASST
jgi:hypothetical protein